MAVSIPLTALCIAVFAIMTSGEIRVPLSADDDPSVTMVYADLLIPGRGDPISSGVVMFYSTNGTIIFAGPASQAPQPTHISATFKLPVVMPGMWDAHTHYGGGDCTVLAEGNSFTDLASGYFPSKYEHFACAIQQLRETLCAGVTSVRELGGQYGQALKHITEAGLFPAPHYHYAGKAIGMTGGHTDQQFLPVSITRNDRDDMWEGFGSMCDGIPNCLRQVREQIRSQADVIKVMTSGGVLSAFDNPIDQQLSVEEVKAIVEEATRARRAVAAHAHGVAGIASAIAAGIHSIEHGSYMTADLAQQIALADMIYVPTITITQTFNQTERPSYYTPAQWAKGQQVLYVHTQAVHHAMDAGITILTGTDCPGDCAKAGREALYLYQFGMTPLQAIECATANGPLSLGNLGMAPLTGQLKEGYLADIIAFASSPLANMSMLADPAAVTHVFKAGQLFKTPTPVPGQGPDVCANSKTNFPSADQAKAPSHVHLW